MHWKKSPRSHLFPLSNGTNQSSLIAGTWNILKIQCFKTFGWPCSSGNLGTATRHYIVRPNMNFTEDVISLDVSHFFVCSVFVQISLNETLFQISLFIARILHPRCTLKIRTKKVVEWKIGFICGNVNVFYLVFWNIPELRRIGQSFLIKRTM